jgi:hypothetical protein
LVLRSSKEPVSAYALKPSRARRYLVVNFTSAVPLMGTVTLAGSEMVTALHW